MKALLHTIFERYNAQSMSFDEMWMNECEWTNHKNDKSAARSDPTKPSTFWEIRLTNSRDWVFLRVWSLCCKLGSWPLLLVLQEKMGQNVENSKSSKIPIWRFPEILCSPTKSSWTHLKAHTIPVVRQRGRFSFPVFQKSHSWNLKLATYLRLKFELFRHIWCYPCWALSFCQTHRAKFHLMHKCKYSLK